MTKTSMVLSADASFCEMRGGNYRFATIRVRSTKVAERSLRLGLQSRRY